MAERQSGKGRATGKLVLKELKRRGLSVHPVCLVHVLGTERALPLRRRGAREQRRRLQRGTAGPGSSGRRRVQVVVRVCRAAFSGEAWRWPRIGQVRNRLGFFGQETARAKA